MSTPAAIVSGIAPGKRGFTSSSAGRPSTSRRSCTLATPIEPDGGGDRRRDGLELGVVHGQAGDRDAGVDPRPGSRHGGHDVSLAVRDDVHGVLLPGQELLDDQRGIDPQRGQRAPILDDPHAARSGTAAWLDDHREGPGSRRCRPRRGGPSPGTRVMDSQRLSEGVLVQATSSVAVGGAASVVPATSCSSARRVASGGSSTSTVDTSTSISSCWHMAIELVDERGVCAGWDDPPTVGRNEVEPAGPAVHVGREDVGVRTCQQGPDHRHTGRAPGTGHENLGHCCSFMQRAAVDVVRAPCVVGTRVQTRSRPG